MEDVGLPERAETNQNSPKKRTFGERTGQNTKLEASNRRSKELRTSIGGRRSPVVGESTMHPHARDGACIVPKAQVPPLPAKKPRFRLGAGVRGTKIGFGLPAATSPNTPFFSFSSLCFFFFFCFFAHSKWRNDVREERRHGVGESKRSPSSRKKKREPRAPETQNDVVLGWS